MDLLWTQWLCLVRTATTSLCESSWYLCVCGLQSGELDHSMPRIIYPGLSYLAQAGHSRRRATMERLRIDWNLTSSLRVSSSSSFVRGLKPLDFHKVDIFSFLYHPNIIQYLGCSSHLTIESIGGAGVLLRSGWLDRKTVLTSTVSPGSPQISRPHHRQIESHGTQSKHSGNSRTWHHSPPRVNGLGLHGGGGWLYPCFIYAPNFLVGARGLWTFENLSPLWSQPH